MMIDDEDQTMIIAKQLKGSVIPTIMTNHHFSTTSPYFFVGQNPFFRECFQKTKL
jgi:3-deoxy-D-arabino-heptulosonate 7-phosphate (DAHP) synthase